LRYFFNLLLWSGFALFADAAAASSIDAAIAAYKQDDYATAWPVFKTLADKGDARAQWYAGTTLLNGEGSAADNKEAINWYRKSAEQKYAPAYNSLGFMYQKGLGLAQDSKQATAYFRMSAEQGNSSGQANLALNLADGDGVPQDFNEAMKWFQLSAKQNNGLALNGIGVFYEKGQGVKQDQAQAVNWYRKSVDQGHAAGRHNLADCFAEGRGVTRNTAVAYALYTLAGSKRKAALTGRAMLAAKMRKEDIVKGEALAVQMEDADDPLVVMDAFVKKGAGR
jgi:uncharacterized protein